MCTIEYLHENMKFVAVLQQNIFLVIPHKVTVCGIWSSFRSPLLRDMIETWGVREDINDNVLDNDSDGEDENDKDNDDDKDNNSDNN